MREEEAVNEVDEYEIVVKRMLDAYVARISKSDKYLKMIDDAIERARGGGRVKH